MKQLYIKLACHLLFIAYFANATQAQGRMYVHHTDGKQQSIVLSNIDKLTFSGENMLVTFKTPPVKNYTIAHIKYYNFKYFHSWGPGVNPNYVIRIFPNPTVNEFSIESSVEINEIVLYNMVGQELKHIIPDSDVTTLRLDDYRKGVYVLRIMTAEGILSEKIIKD